MIRYTEAVFRLQPLLQLQQPVILDFFKPAADAADQMMVHMIMAVTAEVITCHSVAEIHFFNDMQLAQQLKGPVHCGQSQMRVAVFYSHIDFFYA
ncbi:hypothetical protein D3C80_1513460 [compost metagenome]